jgi:hypothetical protein
MGGIKNKGKLFKVNKGGKRMEEQNSPRRKKVAFYRPQRNTTDGTFYHVYFTHGPDIPAPMEFSEAPRISRHMAQLQVDPP